jgi:SAM-dependent methyltransferase
MSIENTDRIWEKYGILDPYYGVLTDERFKRSNLNSAVLAEFFKSGEIYVDELFSFIKRTFNLTKNPNKILDFGCGVGRLVIPFSKHSEFVVGVDVSDSMLIEAKKNCALRSITNVTFARSNDVLSELTDKFDLINSTLVFQHIPVIRGEIIFKRLLDCLTIGGIGIIHFTYARLENGRFPINIPPSIKMLFPFYNIIRKCFKGIPLSFPEMQMNCYNLNRLLHILQMGGINELHTQLIPLPGFLSVMLYFKK